MDINNLEVKVETSYGIENHEDVLRITVKLIYDGKIISESVKKQSLYLKK